MKSIKDIYETKKQMKKSFYNFSSEETFSDKEKSSYDDFCYNNFNKISELYKIYDEIVRHIELIRHFVENNLNDNTYAQEVSEHSYDNTNLDQPIPKTKEEYTDRLLSNIDRVYEDLEDYLYDTVNKIKKLDKEIEKIKEQIKI